MITNKDLTNINNRRSRVPNLPVIIAVFMVLLMGLMLLHQVSRSENFVNPIEILQGTPLAAANELLTITQDDVTVYVPPDATTQAGTITIAAAQPDLMMVSDNTEWMLHKVANLEFQTPNGLLADISFSQPLDICFRLTEQQWQEFSAQPGIYQVRHYIEEANPPYWEVLPQTTYPDQRQVCGQSYTLSAFALAIRVDTQVPVTGPTMMSNMVPTRTPIQAVPTRERRRDGASSEGVLNSVPTNAPPTQPPPSNPPPTQAPAEPIATNPPTVEPTQEPPPTDVPTEQPTEEPTQEPEPTQPPVLPEVQLPGFPLPLP